MVVDIEVPAKLHITIKFLCDGNTHLVLIVVMEMVLSDDKYNNDDDDDDDGGGGDNDDCEPTLLFLP